MGNPYPANVTDEGGETRIQGFVNFTDSGNQPGATTPVATLALSMAAAAPSGGGATRQFAPFLTFPADYSNNQLGDQWVTFTAPIATVAADGQVFTVSSGSLSITSNPDDQYALVITVIVQNETGSQSLELNYEEVIAESAEGGTVTLALADITATAITGTDLSFSTESGIVTTTAGGNFTTFVTVFAGWN